MTYPIIALIAAIGVVAFLVWLLGTHGIRRGAHHDRHLRRRRSHLLRRAPHEADRVAR